MGEANTHSYGEKKEKFPVWVFHPYEPTRLGWDALIAFVMLYVLVSTPIKICFKVDNVLGSPWSVVDLVADIFFLADVLFSFSTAYFESSLLVTLRRKIAKRYICGWFALDLITSIPFDWILATVAHSNSRHFSKIAFVLKIARVARLVKLLRLLKLSTLMSQWENNSTYWITVIRLSKFLFLVGIIAHISACIFVGVANVYRGNDEEYDNYYGFNEDSWPVRFNYTWEHSQAIMYLRALYWAFTTLTTVGYGDITPLLPYEIVFTIFVQICGTSLFGVIIGNMASLITRDDETQLMIKEKIKSVAHYIRHRKFPDVISKKIKRHFEYTWKHNQVSKEGEILADMPQALRAECALFIHKEIINCVPFLKNLGHDVVPSLVTRLRPVLCFRGDVIVQEELFGSEMFFISEGKTRTMIAYRRSAVKIDQILIGTLLKGDFFGEYAVIMDQAKHPASIIAEADCDLHVLSRPDFVEFGQEYPIVYAQIISICKQRFLQLTKSIISKRQIHIMKLNVLEFDKKDAKARGEDPDELTITPEFQEHLADVATKRASVTTLFQRLDYKKRLVQQKLAVSKHSSPKQAKPKILKYLQTAVLRQNSLPSSLHIKTPKLIKVGSRNSNSYKIAATDVKATSDLERSRSANALLERKKLTIWEQACGLFNEGIKMIFSSEDDPAVQAEAFRIQRLKTLELQDSESKIEEKVKLPWWILVKVLSWKNRAQLTVAVQNIEVVEQRHHNKYNLRTKHLDDSKTKKPLDARSPVSAPWSGWKEHGHHSKVSKAFEVAIQELSSQQIETQEEVKDLQILMEDMNRELQIEMEEMKAELRTTTHLLSLVVQDMSKRHDYPRQPRRPTTAGPTKDVYVKKRAASRSFLPNTLPRGSLF